MVALEETATYDETLKLVTESELSRIPVYRNSLDEVAGVLHAKTLLADVKKASPPSVPARQVRDASPSSCRKS